MWNKALAPVAPGLSIGSGQMERGGHLQRGMTLVELIVAIVIIAVGLAGMLSVFNNTVKNSADPMIRKQLLALAEGMMDEVMLLPFEADPATNWSGSATCANRDQFDEVDDFSGYTNQDVCDYGGTPILPGYKLSVEVDDSQPLDGVPATAARRITVTAEVGGESLRLVGWRTNWAQP